MRDRLTRFMAGRYGNDQLNQFLLVIGVVSIILDMMTRLRLFSLVTIICLVLSYYRMLSRDFNRRYEENRKFLSILEPLISKFKGTRGKASQMKSFHIYKCPDCGQKIRVPRGKGKIRIHCPKCGGSFIKRS